MNPLDQHLSPDLKIISGKKGEKRLKWLSRLSKMLKTSDCSGCKLHKERPDGVAPVPGEGRGRIMFVGHRIGPYEANSSRPAMGKASKHGFRMFAEALADLNIPLRDVRDAVLDYSYVTNASRCGHDTERVVVTKASWRKCGQRWLKQEMDQVDPVIMVFWKTQVARELLKDDVPEVGKVFEGNVMGRKVPCFVMNHPVVVSRDYAYKEVVEAQFRILARWLYNEGYLVTEPPNSKDHEDAEHLLVTNEEQLETMVEDLWDSPWVGLDTETGFFGSYGQLTDYEEEKGALQWYHPNFGLVCTQLAGLEHDGDEWRIARTYTIATGFRERMTGLPQQDLTEEQMAQAINDLFRHAPNGQKRNVCVFNASFDGPVMLRAGVDILGLTRQDLQIQLLDLQLILGRYNEHLGDIKHLSLDDAAKIFLGESKGGGFKKYFAQIGGVQHFPYIDLSNEGMRESLLDYTGEDPRKTLLVTLEVMQALDEHVEELSEYTTDELSSLPRLGFDPLPKPADNAEEATGSRLRDTAIPLDHQMLPIIAQMEAVGFKMDLEAFERARTFATEKKRLLLEKIRDYYPWFKPNSGPNALRVLRFSMEELVGNLNAFIDKAYRELDDPEQTVGRIVRGMGLDNSLRNARSLKQSDLEAAYEETYTKIDAQQKTIEDKFLVWLESGVRQAEEAMQKSGLDVSAFLPLVDTERLRTFFTLVFLYKQVDRKWSTYFERFKYLADREDILHPSYKQTDTVSGRWSGNFQNVPRGGPEDLEFVEELLTALDIDLPEDEDEKNQVLQANNLLDVRQYISVPQPEDLNRLFDRMNFSTKEGKPFKVKDESYVAVLADFAAQEDRMGFALSGDPTKKFLLEYRDDEGKGLDTHFVNVAYCFDKQLGFDCSGLVEALESFVETGDLDMEAEPVQQLFAAYEYITAPERKAEMKAQMRTPMKNVHYGSQYGAQAKKLHTMVAPIMAKQGKTWTFRQTEELFEKYSFGLYRVTTEEREKLIRRLDEVPFVEYPIYGTIRHAKTLQDEVDRGEHLSVANAFNQGTSAYVTKTAMLRMRHVILANAHRWNLVEVGGDTFVGLLLQVHDEIGIICPERLADEVAYALESAMKIIVGPPEEAPEDSLEPQWDASIPDALGDTGWLFLPDNAFKGTTLFDADAEVKRTVAKADVLPDGSDNVIASTHKPKTIEALQQKYRVNGVNGDHPIVLARKDYAPCIM